ncbi:SRP54-type protein, putative [Trichomonas vaginalis G3]|uniref:signal-recognition-particle GTPase n=1 Tax=Trichomonas vaginalis (strain ATCC PRA-98 / G3) TaxID=412133 RepID=A2E0A3_TRIV3|nr:signal recognition particle 54 kDa protein family [Trichomonas vaginalis G3]EAY13903.1 SRP54-type protein, putative [Trichomonas vaginalis G3]KAI5520913.1 signal recognition particle 54 kDa protein family [Trichomonas vaginalis G3]|eukprot:XP_001326126.1 SRP54-type protein [Trichomonas vaginalis G3]
MLQDLGEKLMGSIKKLSESKTIDEKVYVTFMAEVAKSLIAADCSKEIVFDFSRRLKDSINFKEIPPGLSIRRVIEKAVFNELVKLIDPGIPAYKPQKKMLNIFMMVGLQGAGKTTTVTKLANFYKRRNWRTGVIAADTFRAGAREQLMQNAQTARIPYFVDFTEQDPVQAALKGIEKFRKDKYEIVIIDTSGRHMQEEALFAEMKALAAAVNPHEIIFVMDGTIGQAAYDQALGFKNAVGVGSIIITKLDSNAKGGGALSAVAATNSPISFIGSGEQFTDLEWFDPNSFVSRLLGIQDPGVIQRTLEEIDKEANKEIAEHIQKGQFSFRDLYNQYKMVLDVGNFNSMLDSITIAQGIKPGMKNDPEHTKDTVKRILVVIDAMSTSEIENPLLFKNDESRIARLCSGSGMPPPFVQYVINEQRRWETMFKRMDKKTLALMSQTEQPNFANERQFKEQVMKMAKSMDKEMLRSVGGIEGLEASMRQAWVAGKNKKK